MMNELLTCIKLIKMYAWEKSFAKAVAGTVLYKVDPFPHNKILDPTKLKVFAADKLNVTKMIISIFH